MQRLQPMEHAAFVLQQLGSAWVRGAPRTCNMHPSLDRIFFQHSAAAPAQQAVPPDRPSSAATGPTGACQSPGLLLQEASLLAMC